MLRSLSLVKEEVQMLLLVVEREFGRLAEVIHDILAEAVEMGNIEGAPVTTVNLERTVIRDLKASEVNNLRDPLTPPPNEATIEVAKEKTSIVFRLRSFVQVHEGFRNPNMTLRKAWHHWTKGNVRTWGRPWRLIQSSEVGDNSSRVRLKCYRLMVLAIEDEVHTKE